MRSRLDHATAAPWAGQLDVADPILADHRQPGRRSQAKAHLTDLAPHGSVGPSTQEHPATSAADMLSLVDAVLTALVYLRDEDEDAWFLARELGAHSLDALHLDALPSRLGMSQAPLLTRMRSLDRRTWLLGAAARIIGPSRAQPSFLRDTAATRERLRSWMWRRSYAWSLAPLAAAVRRACTARRMVAWTTALDCTSPRTGAEWFRRSLPQP
jgi:hypothetical protein